MDQARAQDHGNDRSTAKDDAGAEHDRAQPDGQAQGQAADAAVRRMAKGGLDGTQRALAMAKAIELASRGMRDVNKMTDQVFFALHADRDPHQKLASGSSEAQEWVELRDEVVRPQVEAFAGMDKAAAAHEQAAPSAGAVHSAQTEEAQPALAPGGPANGFKPLAGNQKEAPTRPDEAKVLNALRAATHRFDPKWLAEAQGKLGVSDASGAMNTETLRKLREHAGDQKLGADKILDRAFLNQVLEGEPFLHSEEGFKHQAPDGSASTNADHAAQAAGYASYAAYKKDMHDFKFLGVKGRFQVHDYLKARLEAAEGFLRSRHPGKDDKDIVKAIGWNGTIVGSYGADEASVAQGMAHMHTMGLAVDFDPEANPYIFDKSNYGSGADWWYGWYHDMFRNSVRVYGGEAITEQSMMEWSQKLSTEELQARIEQASQSFEKYLSLGEKDKETIVATLKGAGFSDVEANDQADQLKGHSGKYKKSARDIFNVRGNGAHGITNLRQELLVALRDVAGLAWGGTEMSGVENGDFMHFDCRNDAFGYAVYSKHAPKK